MSATTSTPEASPAPMTARMEVTLKFTAIPETVPGPNGWKTFALTADGRTYRVTVRPKMWNKLDAAAKDWPQWTAVLRGKLGTPTSDGFEVAEASLDVFERKDKAPKEVEAQA